jgi:hypothetical protein
LISKEKGGKKPLFYWQQALSIPKSKVLYKTKRLAFHTIVIISRQKKRRAYALLSLRLSDATAPELRSKGMEALQANHERPANPYEKALPFSSVHPHGLPYESRAEAPEPSCLRSIARNRGSNGKGKRNILMFRRNHARHGAFVISCTLLAGDSQPLLTISPNKCLKLFFFLLPLLSVLWHLLQWRLAPHAELPASTDQAFTATSLLAVNASILKP